MRNRALVVSTMLTAAALSTGCGGEEADTSGSGGAGGSTVASGGSGATGGSATTGSGGSGGSTATTGSGGSGEIVIGGDRPVHMYIPTAYDPATPAPLVVLLHGYGAGGIVQSGYFGFVPVADARGFIYAVPDGTVDASSKKFWNATDACCDFGMTGVDDSGYLSGVVDEIKAHYNVDPKRVYFVGHSNGGFMSYRMACDHADQIAAIVSLAGATFDDDAACNPSEPVAVAQIHGTADETVAYPGGIFFGATFPGAVETVEKWAGYDGCELTTTDGAAKDIEGSIAGDETTVKVYGSGCQAGGHAELWTIPDGTHIPSLADGFADTVFDFLEAHPKP